MALLLKFGGFVGGVGFFGGFWGAYKGARSIFRFGAFNPVQRLSWCPESHAFV